MPRRRKVGTRALRSARDHRFRVVKAVPKRPSNQCRRGEVFDGRELPGMDLRRCDLTDASFVNCDLSGALFTDADIAGANFSGSNLQGADLRRVAGHGAEPKFIGTDLSGADLRFSELDGLDATEACMAGAALDGASFSDGRLVGADLSKTYVRWATNGLARAIPRHSVNFAGADLAGATFSSADIPGGCFDGATMDGARWDGALAVAASFRQTNGERTSFDGADLSLADFTEARISGATFHRTALVETIFVRADIRGVSFSRSIVVAASISGSTTDRETNFDSVALGLEPWVGSPLSSDGMPAMVILTGRNEDVLLSLRTRTQGSLPAVLVVDGNALELQRPSHILTRLTDWSHLVLWVNIARDADGNYMITGSQTQSNFSRANQFQSRAESAERVANELLKLLSNVTHRM